MKYYFSIDAGAKMVSIMIGLPVTQTTVRYYMRKSPSYAGKRPPDNPDDKLLADPHQPVGADRKLTPLPKPEGIVPKKKPRPASFFLRNAPAVDNRYVVEVTFEFGDITLIYLRSLIISWKWAGGGFVSTARNVAFFGDAILHNRLFSQQTKEKFLTPVELPKSTTSTSGELELTSTEYALGWSVKNIDGRRIVSHGGGAVGASSYVRR